MFNAFVKAAVIGVATEAARLRIPSNIGNGSKWPFFKGDPVTGTACGTCAGIPMSQLQEPDDAGLGCMDLSIMPVCDLQGDAFAQAGGHAGTFHKLKNNRLAKHTIAFETPGEEHSEVKIQNSRTEWEIYMEMWCVQRLYKASQADESKLKKLLLNHNVPALLKDHPLRPFALGMNGSEQWAPNFYGVCKLEGTNGGQTMQYLVIDNLLSSFDKPCQLDLKLGYRTVEPDEETGKRLRQTVGDILSPSTSDGARLAGYKVWSPYGDRWRKMTFKALSPLLPLSKVFDRFSDWSGYVSSDELASMQSRLLEMSAWWSETGKKEINAIALSALFIRECEPRIQGTATIGDVQIYSTIDFDDQYEGKNVLAEQLKGAYVTIEDDPEGTLYPTNGSGQNGSHHQSTRSLKNAPDADAIQFVTEPSWKLPEWTGTQFELKYSPVQDIDLVLNIWKFKDPSKGQKEWIGEVKLPFDAGKQCSIVENNGKALDMELCLNITKSPYETMAQSAAPVVKLIDYAHMYQKSLTPLWPEDGVDMGFLAAATHLSRKIQDRKIKTHVVAAPSLDTGDMTEITDEPQGKGFKCKSSKENTVVELHVCQTLAQHRDKLLMSWKELRGNKRQFGHGVIIEQGDSPRLVLGECRVCNQFVRIDVFGLKIGRKYMGKKWRTFKQPWTV